MDAWGGSQRRRELKGFWAWYGPDSLFAMVVSVHGYGLYLYDGHGGEWFQVISRAHAK